MHFQPSLSGTLHLARTNAFFMGGGKALVNAYYRSAEALGVQVRYDAPVDALELETAASSPRGLAAASASQARACVLAAGGFESNREWLREAWGQNERGEWPADNFLIRGTRFNQGVLLKFMIDAGADIIGDPSQSHCVAIDARAPLYDGGICTRVDCVSLGVDGQPRRACASTTRARISGPSATRSGAGWWRSSRDRSATRIIDSKAIGRFMPPVFPGEQAQTLPRACAASLGLPEPDLRANAGRLQRRVPCRHASTTPCSTTATPKA